MNMVGAASSEVVLGCVVVMEETPRWMGDEGTKPSPMERMAAEARANAN